MAANSSYTCFSLLISIFLSMLIWGSIADASSNVQWITYFQRWNHFDDGGPYQNETFPQRVVVDFTYWGGATNNGSILVCFGGEAAIDSSIGNIGVISEAAPRFRSLVVYIEHRFYGTSVPFGSIDKALSNPIVRSYLSTQQALADFADVILSLKTNLSAYNSPVIVVGGSYPGMLAAWFRLRYPDIAVGALAASAPVLFYQDSPPDRDFCSIVTRDFEHISEDCADIIRDSWRMIDIIAASDNGLELLTSRFNSCAPLPSSYELKLILVRLYSFAAQYNGRFDHWIHSVCDPIIEAANKNPIDRIASAVIAAGEGDCTEANFTGLAPPFDLLDSNSQKAWNWQVCSELAINRGCNGDNPLLPRYMFRSRTEVMESCQIDYFMLPDPNRGRPIYGIEDIRAGTNIIFSNGLMDPLSSFGIVEDLSDTVVAITTKQGSHCLDVAAAQHDDPKWLKKQRAKEIHVMSKWISNAPNMSFPRILLLVLVFLGYILGI